MVAIFLAEWAPLHHWVREEWKQQKPEGSDVPAPLNDMPYAELPAFHPVRISEPAERTYGVFARYQGREVGRTAIGSSPGALS